MVNLGPIKVEFGDRDRLLMHRLTDSLSKFTEELKRYNDAGEKVEIAVATVNPVCGIEGCLVKHHPGEL